MYARIITVILELYLYSDPKKYSPCYCACKYPLKYQKLFVIAKTKYHKKGTVNICICTD